MKALKHTINWIIWSLLALYLLVMLVIQIPSFQAFIGSRIAETVGKKLGTTVKVGRVDFGWLNRIIIDDVLIFDQHRKQMLQVGRLAARIDLLPLADGKISVSSVQLFGAEARLYRANAQKETNFQFIVDSLASKDTTARKPLDLRINSVIVRHSSVSYDCQDQPLTQGEFNPHHLNFRGISAYISLKELTDSAIDLNVKRLQFEEHAGLSLKHLSFRLKANAHGALIQDFDLQMPNSLIKTDSIDVTYRFNGQKFSDKGLSGELSIHDSYITPSDLRCFHNSLKNFQRPIHFDIISSIANEAITVSNLRIYSDAGDLSLVANGQMKDVKTRRAWHIQLQQLSLSDAVIEFIQKNIPQLPVQIRNIGNLQFVGNIGGDAAGALSAQATIKSGIGRIALTFLMASDRSFHGQLKTDDTNLRQLLDDQRFGVLATDVHVKGQLFDKQQPTINAVGTISRFDYNDYAYHDVTVNGLYSANAIAGLFKVSDPNFEAEVDGELSHLHDNQSHVVRIDAVIRHLRPKVLNLTDKWNDSDFSATIDADFTAKTLNDAEGTLRISNFSMYTPETDRAYRLDNFFVTSGYEGGRHFLTLISDFAKADLRGDFEYATLSQSVINYIGSKLPTLPNLPPTTKKASNNFSLRLQMYKTDWLQQLLGVDLVISHPVTLNAIINDASRTINVDGNFPEFTYQGASYSDGIIQVTTPADTMKCDISIKRYAKTGHLSLGLKAKAVDNHLTTALTWDDGNKEMRMSGELNCITQLYRNLDAKPEAHVRIMPSHIILNDTVWNVEPSDILYSDNNLLVDHFTVHHSQQHISIDGKAGKHPEDQLTVDLNDVEVAYILNLVNFHAVEFSGKASGKAMVRHLFEDFDAHADLTVSNFKFENGRMGTLHALADWNKEEKRIDINAISNDGPDAMTYINGFVSPTHNTIDLVFRARGTHIDFMHHFTNSFLSYITGHADGDLRLAGTLDNINLTGRLAVEGDASITALKTAYHLQCDTVTFIPDEIKLPKLKVTDKFGNQGTLTGAFHHQHLTNLTFDLFASADNLLAYDIKDFGDSNFYGTVFASGDIAIKGRSGEVTIDCNVTPQKNTVFVYNASSPEVISNQEFIEWGSASAKKNANVAAQVLAVAPDIPSDLYINFLINCTPDASIRLLMDANANDYITLNGDGTIRATYYNKGPFNMFGTYTVERGTYGITIQNIIRKNFSFNRGGTITFGGDPYNAALSLQAVHTVNGVSLSDLNIGNSFASNTIRVNCLMNIGGQPRAPQVDFDIEMPTVNADEQQMVRSIINGQQEMNQQVLYLLGIGRFYSQGQNNAEGQQDRTSLAMQSLLSGTLSSQINSLLSTVIKNDNWNFGANISTGNEGWHNAEYGGLISGRMLNNRLLLNGQFGYRDNATRATPSFIGDFDIQYLLYPSGNLALKVYNQTNDRYFTKSSLNTQGLGIIMKKDFNSLRDLFSRRRKSSQP